MAAADFYPSRRKSGPRGSAGAPALNDGHLLADAGLKAVASKLMFKLIVFLPWRLRFNIEGDLHTTRATERKMTAKSRFLFA